MKLFTRFILVIVLVIPQTKYFGQIFKPFPEGLGIEIGVGQNNFFWSAPSGIETIGAGPIDRTYFTLTPNIRINYSIQFDNNFSAMVFTGYNRFGGSSSFEYGHQSKYYFNAIEGGSFFFLNFSSFHFGVGLKANYHIYVQFEHSTSTDSYKNDRSKWFKDWSGDIGIRSTYAFIPFSISLEAWFGLNDLRNIYIIPSGGVIKENHYRLLFGYTL